MKFTYHDTNRITLEMTFDQYMSLRAMCFEAKMKAADRASIAKGLKQPRSHVNTLARYAREHAAVADALESASESWPHETKTAKAKPAAAGYKKRAAKKPKAT